ncbi:unnamed protein product [Somion occarium]|uniref:Cytochrome P450 n=1 Tax=Somion occarium TaxID=3059160 RepID=A0ABP1D5L4_9APHY
MIASTQYLYTLAIVLPLFILYNKWRATRSLSSVPTIGPSAPILSYIGAFRFVHHAVEMLNEGYQKYKGGMFKIAQLDRWLVIVTSPELIEELRKLPEDAVNFMQAAADTIETRYTFGPVVHYDPFFVGITQAHLTKHLDDIFPEIQEEVMVAFNDLISNVTEEWTQVPALSVAQQVVSRASSRTFVGLPMCRHPGYIGLSVKHALDVTNTRKTLGWFPGMTRYFVTLFTNESQKTVRLAKQYLSPTINERLAAMKELGANWDDKPADMLQWIIEEALARNYDLDVIVQTVLMINFVSIHNTSNSFTHALYHLAAQPEFLVPLREELTSVISEEGLTKAAMSKMRKLDSFLRESQRMNGTGIVHLFRKTFKDVTLSNGVTVPADSYLGTPLLSIQHDEELYPNPEVFDPWRFSNMREGASAEGVKYQYVTTSPEYLAFGHGRHACPGRFFAANEIKTMLCHVILNYDVKFENEGVLFRKRHV